MVEQRPFKPLVQSSILCALTFSFKWTAGDTGPSKVGCALTFSFKQTAGDTGPSKVSCALTFSFKWTGGDTGPSRVGCALTFSFKWTGGIEVRAGWVARSLFLFKWTGGDTGPSGMRPFVQPGRQSKQVESGKSQEPPILNAKNKFSVGMVLFN